MTTHHFGTDVNPALFFEIPDPANPGQTKRPPAGTSIAVVSASTGDPATGATLTPITTLAEGYWTYTTTDVESIYVRGTDENGAPQWIGPIYSEEHDAEDYYTKAEADARYAAAGAVGQSSVASTGITDATAVGRAGLTAVDKAAGRAAIDALASTAVSPFGLTLLDDADAPTALDTLGALAASDLPLATDTLLEGDNLTWDDTAQAWTNRQPNVPLLPTYLLRGTVLNPGQSVPSDWPDGAIAFVRATAPTLGMTQIGKNGAGTSGTTVVTTLTDAVAIGDYVYVSFTGASPGTVLSTVTVTDSGSNTYVLRGQRLQGATIQGQDFSAKATTALAAGATVTVTVGAALGDMEVTVSKMTGLVTATTAWDQSGQNSGTNVTQVTVATGGATAQANELAVLSLHWNNGTVVDPATWATAGWTQVGVTQTSGSATAKNVAVFVKTLTSVATVSVTPQVSAAGIVVALLNTYRAA